LLADISAKSAVLGNKLHPHTAASLADLVRLMNSYYSNLIEGHNTKPADIERALANQLDDDQERRNLQLEAAAHVRVQAKVDQLALKGELPEPASNEFVQWLHKQFYADVPGELLRVQGRDKMLLMVPGEYRSQPAHDVAVGRHNPPSSEVISKIMAHFESQYGFEGMGQAARILVIPASHHRFNYIHPFLDGNGRVSRLMSHAMAANANIGAQGLWSVSRGLARGLGSRTEYKSMMDSADAPRQGDLDGRGNLSLKALTEFTEWFLKICIDQIDFMSGLFEIEKLNGRLGRLVENTDRFNPEAKYLLEEALLRGEFERGAAARITGLPERSARRVLGELVKVELLASETPKGPVSLRFPVHSLEVLFPRLYPVS